MKKAGCPLERISWQHRLVGSADFFQAVPAVIRMGEPINKQNSAKLATATLYRVEQVEDMHLNGGTLLVEPCERLIKQFKPIAGSGNRWIDHPGNWICADALKEKFQPGR